MIGREIMGSIGVRARNETSFKVNDGVNTIEIKTTSIHQMVKKFAKNMFRSLGLDNIGK